MNKAFDDLIYQSGLIADGCWDELGTYEQEAIERFSKLMVEEACQAFWSEACHVSDLAYEEYSRNSKKIKEHFGVEK
jgi:hypothetical protein